MGDNFTWIELEKKFEEVAEDLANSRIDTTWGSIEESWRLSGFSNSLSQQKFLFLAKISGQKLISSQEIYESIDDLKNEKNPIWFWYKAIKSFIGNFEMDYIGEQVKKDTGESMGGIFSGRIKNPVEASKLLCLKLSSIENIDSNDEKVKLTSAKIFWNKFALPVVIGVVTTLIATLIIMYLL